MEQQKQAFNPWTKEEMEQFFQTITAQFNEWCKEQRTEERRRAMAPICAEKIKEDVLLAIYYEIAFGKTLNLSKKKRLELLENAISEEALEKKGLQRAHSEALSRVRSFMKYA